MQSRKPKSKCNAPNDTTEIPPGINQWLTYVFKSRDDISSIGVNFFSEDPVNRI